MENGCQQPQESGKHHERLLTPASVVVVITTEGALCNPQCIAYQFNKEAHIDYYGHLTQPRHRTPI